LQLLMLSLGEVGQDGRLETFIILTSGMRRVSNNRDTIF
jgi:hypothetical protein